MLVGRSILFLIVLVSTVFYSQLLYSQDTSKVAGHQMIFGGGMDVYFGHDVITNSSTDLPFYVSSSSLNSIDVNLAWMDITFSSEEFSFHFVPAIGSYMSNNYKHEPTHFQFPVEASVSYNLNRRRWKRVEAGVLNSPITNETPFSKDQLLYTRSLASENVPYYLCGVKSKFALSNSLTSFIYVVNGWQEISNPNKRIALIHQLEWKPSDKNLWNWNVYLGNEEGNNSDSLIGYRYFSDLFYTYNLDGKVSFTSCMFLGVQQLNTMTNNSTYWYQINSALRYRLKQNYSLAMRAEYFNDPSGLILQSKLNSAEIFGLALNVSKSFNHALLRLEGNYLCDLGGRKLFASGNQTNSIAQKYIVRLNWTTFF